MSVLPLAGLAKDGCRQEAVDIGYTSVKAACQAVAALHKQNVGGGGAIWARQLGGEVILSDKIHLLMFSLLCSSITNTCLDFRSRCVFLSKRISVICNHLLN